MFIIHIESRVRSWLQATFKLHMNINNILQATGRQSLIFHLDQPRHLNLPALERSKLKTRKEYVDTWPTEYIKFYLFLSWWRAFVLSEFTNIQS